MKLTLLTTVLALAISWDLTGASPRKHQHFRGERPAQRMLQDDPCARSSVGGADDISNDRDISNDSEATRSNIFDHGTRRRAKTGKGASKTSVSDPSSPSADDFTTAPVATCAPTRSPTKAPTTPAPTQKPFLTETTDRNAVSTCIDDPSVTGIYEDYVMPFKYNLYVTPDANQSTSISLVEMLLHYGVAEEFLRCNFDEAAPYFVVSVGSSRNATLLDEDCDTTNDPIPPVDTDCLVILSDVNMTVFYPTIYPLSDGTATPGIWNATGEYLNSSMADGDFVWGDVVQTTFQGFVDDDNSTDVAAGVIGRAAEVGSGNVIFGSAMMAGLAALCLLLLMLFAVRQRRRKNAAYLKQIDGMNEANATFSMDGDEPGLESLSSEGKVQRVLNNGFGYGADGPSGEQMGSLADQPNVHHCASATCPVCSVKRTNPTFLSRTDLVDGGVRWHNPPPRASFGESYDSLDTVNF